MAADKGYYGLDYRSLIGLHRPSMSGAATGATPDPMWDCYVGPIPFLLCNSKDRPYARKSVQSRRERLDQAREPGENSLDNAVWLRSQTSWHLGAGQAYSEPLEESAEIARFRFNASAGVNPWTPGQLTLLNSTSQITTGARCCVGVPGYGVLTSTAAAGVRMFNTVGGSTQISTKTVGKLTSNGTRWFGISTSGLEWGDLSGATNEGAFAKAGLTALHWGKDRLWLGAGKELFEVTATPPTLPAATYTFRSGSIVDIDSGAGGIYLLVNDAFTSIFALSVKDDGTLNPPREVATLPRGEVGNFIYGYLGRYLVIGTNKGVRVADCSSVNELAVGPIVVAGDCQDAVGDGTYLYTSGSFPSTAGGAAKPGLHRLNLGSVVSQVSAYGDSAAARYAYATDLWAETTGSTWSVTTYNGYLFMVAGSSASTSPLWQQASTLVSRGWVESGQISFSTSERKAWVSMGLEATGLGAVGAEVNTGGATFNPVMGAEVATPFVGDLQLDSEAHAASGWIAHRVTLAVDGSGVGPTLASVGLRAMPAPKRTERIQLPLWCFNHQIDRYGNPAGYDGFAYDRLSDLKALESGGGVVLLTDLRTGEVLRVQIEDVAFENVAAPDGGQDNFGGVLTVTLLVA